MIRHLALNKFIKHYKFSGLEFINAFPVGIQSWHNLQ